MFGDIVEDNFLILGKVVGVYTKNPLREPILAQGEFGTILLIQNEGLLILEGSNPRELVFKVFEVGGEKVKNLSPQLPT